MIYDTAVILSLKGHHFGVTASEKRISGGVTSIGDTQQLITQTLHFHRDDLAILLQPALR